MRALPSRGWTGALIVHLACPRTQSTASTQKAGGGEERVSWESSYAVCGAHVGKTAISLHEQRKLNVLVLKLLWDGNAAGGLGNLNPSH